MAPPFGLTRASSSAKPSSRNTAKPCDAKASFNSITSISSKVRPTCSSTFLEAGAGPIPIIRGSTPAAAIPNTRPRAFKPYVFAASSLANNKAQAPSLTPDALPAVTDPLPSRRKGVARFDNASKLVSARGCSS